MNGIVRCLRPRQICAVPHETTNDLGFHQQQVDGQGTTPVPTEAVTSSGTDTGISTGTETGSEATGVVADWGGLLGQRRN